MIKQVTTPKIYLCNSNFENHGRNIDTEGNRDQVRKENCVVLFFSSHARKIDTVGNRDQVHKERDVVLILAATHAKSTRWGIATKYARKGVYITNVGSHARKVGTAGARD